MLKRLRKSKNDPKEQTKFFLAAREGNLDVVLKYLRKKTIIDLNGCNSSGLTALHLSSKGGHQDVVAILLQRGADVNASTEKGNTAIHFAAFAGQYEIVQNLVEHGASVNLQSQEKFSPLYMAAQENHVRIVQFLLNHYANQFLASQDGFTPLAVAIQQGHDEVVACLLERESGSLLYPSALHVAAKNDNIKAAKLLVEKGHSVNVPSKRGFTPLHVAAHYGNVGVGKLLIEKKADINFQSNTGISPLHVGCSRGKSEIVSVLVGSGGNVTSETKDGLTPLHCAAKSGHEQEVELLLDTGAPVVTKTHNGLSPLHMAVQGDHENCAIVMLSHDAPINDTTKDGLNPLHIAAYYGHLKSAKFLLDNKCDFDSKTVNGLTPLHIACKLNHVELVKLLLQYGAAVDALNQSGLTPIHIAASLGHVEIIDLLLKNGADSNASTTPRRETPLHLAASAHRTEAIRTLLSREGATHINPKDKHGKTPLHIASELGNKDDVELLLMLGAKENGDIKDGLTPDEIREELCDSVLADNFKSQKEDDVDKLVDECPEKEGNVSISYRQPGVRNKRQFVCDLPEELEAIEEIAEKPFTSGIISKADIILADVANLLASDWKALGKQLGLIPSELEEIERNADGDQGLAMLNEWIKKNNGAVSGNDLERALLSIGRDDVIDQCIRDVEEVTDPEDKAIAMACLKAKQKNIQEESIGRPEVINKYGIPAREAQTSVDSDIYVDVDPGVEYELEEVWDGTKWKTTLKSVSSEQDHQNEVSSVSPEHIADKTKEIDKDPETKEIDKDPETIDDEDESEFWSQDEESEDEYQDVVEVNINGESETDGGISYESTRVLLRKRIHKKTVITGSQEETIVTEDTQIDQLNDVPEDIQKAVLQFVDLFLLGESDFDLSKSA